MRRLWAGLLAFTLAAPALRADDKTKKVDAPKGDAKTPAEQFKELAGQFDKDLLAAAKEHGEAKDDKARGAARDKAFKLPETYAAKMLALAEKYPDDPVAMEAQLWVCSAPASRGLPIQPKILQTVRDKAKSDVVKVIATVGLANILFDNEERTLAQTKEAEALFAEVVAKGKDIKELPKEIIEEAEGNLWELRNLVIDKAAPEAESTDLDGKAVNLSAHKGKVVVLDFWATWCGPCVSLIPHERDLVKKHEGKPFVFISVSADEKKEKLKEFLDNEKMPWTHWWGGTDGGVIKKWNIKGFPTFYVIDAKGVLRAKIVGAGEETPKKIDALVDKLVKEAQTKSE
jgi:thiol-disulfide isomerase/thioredoxin